VSKFQAGNTRRNTCSFPVSLHANVFFEASICRLVSRFTNGTQNYCQSDWSFLFLSSLFKKEKKKNYASSKKLLASIKEKGPLGKKSLFTRKEKGGSVRIRRVEGRQTSRPLLIGLKVGRTLMRTSGLNKLVKLMF